MSFGAIIRLSLIAAAAILPRGTVASGGVAEPEIVTQGIYDASGSWDVFEVVKKNELFVSLDHVGQIETANGALWLKVRVFEKGHRGGQWVLEASDPSSFGIQLFEYSSKFESIRDLSGSRLTELTPAFAIELTAQPETVLLMRLRTLTGQVPEVRLRSRIGGDALSRDVWAGLGLGLGAAAVLLVVFLALVDRSRATLWFANHIFVTALMLAVLNGVAALASGWGGVILYFPAVAGAVLLTGTQYMRRAFHGREGVMRMLRGTWALDAVGVVVMLLAGFEAAKWALIGAQLGLLVYFTFGVLLAVRTDRRDGGFRLRTVPWLAGLIGAAAFAGVAFGLWQSGAGITWLSVATLVFAWGEAYRRARSRDDALARTLDRLRDENAKLESSIQQGARVIEDQQVSLLASTKMASLGEMAGGMAHEINNPLTVIQGYIENIVVMAESGTIDLKRVIQFGTKISNSVGRISKIILGLRSIARQAEDDPFGVENVGSIIQVTLDLCQTRFANQGIELKVGDFSRDLWVECRGVQISQILINLLNNAFDALAENKGGWVRIDVTDLADRIELTVTDSGLGIPKGVREKIFDPFYTTKEIGKGTGLGLSISKAIINKHGGEFFLDETHANTRFVMRLLKEQVNQSEGKIFVFR